MDKGKNFIPKIIRSHSKKECKINTHNNLYLYVHSKVVDPDGVGPDKDPTFRNEKTDPDPIPAVKKKPYQTLEKLDRTNYFHVQKVWHNFRSSSFNEYKLCLSVSFQ